VILIKVEGSAIPLMCSSVAKMTTEAMMKHDSVGN